MKLSEIKLSDVKEYSRIDYDDEDGMVVSVLTAAKHFVLSYTGLSADEADTHEDLSIACLCICSDMIDTRNFAVQNIKQNLNPTAEIILNMYSKNLIG